LFLVALIRLICASNRNETAKPAGSSSGEPIFEPDDRRASDFANIELDSESNRALLWADIFVLITIRTPSIESPRFTGAFARHPCREANFLGITRYPR
jgi:hypothetical protein